MPFLSGRPGAASETWPVDFKHVHRLCFENTDVNRKGACVKNATKQ